MQLITPIFGFVAMRHQYHFYPPKCLDRPPHRWPFMQTLLLFEAIGREVPTEPVKVKAIGPVPVLDLAVIYSTF